MKHSYTLPSVIALEAFLFGVFLTQAPNLWSNASIALLAMIALGMWYISLRNYRLIVDTPTSKIHSASQGYVELQGRGQALDGTPLLSPMNGLPVLWYRFQIEERSNAQSGWKRCTLEESDACFQLYDETGSCTIDPAGAHMMVHRHDVEIRDDRRYSQWSLIKHDRIYVLGHFATLAGDAHLPSEREAAKNLLEDWKEDRTHLLKRFDLNGDGTIDLHEWALARKAAIRQVRQDRAAQDHSVQTHLVGQPADGRLFLISDFGLERLTQRYQWNMWLHAAVFIAACVAAAWYSQLVPPG